MNLRETIKSDIKKSMIGRNKVRTTLLRTVIGEIDRSKIKDFSDNTVISIIKKMKENAEFSNNQEEIIILDEYLPTILTEEETINIVKNMFKEKEYTNKDMGSFMKTVKTKYGQTINMKTVSIEFKKSL